VIDNNNIVFNVSQKATAMIGKDGIIQVES